MDLVPSTAAEVIGSTQFELARTTEDGLRLYVRPLGREIADKIIIGTRDFTFLCGDGDYQYLLVPIRHGQILRGEPKPSWRDFAQFLYLGKIYE
jgi:hypothetical protein